MMTNTARRIICFASLLALSELASAQALPGAGNAVQNAVERQVGRQVEQAQSAALERTAEQAAAAAGALVQQRAEAAQAEAVQNQAFEQVQNQVERAQAQAAEQAQAQVERAQAQAAEQAQAQVERVQVQVEGAQGRIEQLQSQVDRTQSQVQQVQAQIERLPVQAAERVQQRGPGSGPGTRQVGEDTAQTAADAAARGVNAAVPDAATAGPADAAATPAAGVDIGAATDTQARAFVEITIEPGVRAVASEWIMVVTPEERARLDAEAADLLTYLTDTEPFALSGGELLTFTVPPDLDADDAILQLVPEALRGLIDRNHVYDAQDDEHEATQGAAMLSLPMPAVCAEPITLGMIDSGIEVAHPAFAASGTRIHQRSFVEAELTQSTGHGTAIAGLLVGRDDGGARDAVLHPLLPAATLYSAAVFHEHEDAGQGATVMRVLAALDWLLQQDGVKVVNMSLAGPPNRLLALAITAAAARGVVVVAAAGNEGPYGPVRYPAAYDEAIGVTAVGRDAGIFRFANQGSHIDYAALGVDVPTALGDGSFGPESGTSLAAPIVSAFLACAVAQHGSMAAALAALDARVLDLGDPGVDAVYGRGLLHP